MPAKRIMILTNRIPYPLKDGGNMAMHAMIYGYKANGWEVFLLSMNTTRHKIEEGVLSHIYQDIHFKTVAVDNDVKPIPTLINYLFSKNANHVVRFKDKGFEQALRDEINVFQPNVVQIESIYLSTYLPVIKELPSVKTILRVHNIEYQIWERLASISLGTLKCKYLRSLANRIKSFEKKSWQVYDLLLPITSIDADMINETVETAVIHTVPFGIDTAKVSVSENERWVGYHIGAMDWLPNKDGIEWFLKDAMPEIHQNIPEFEFYFAGRNMPQQIEGDHQPSVHNMGEVPDADAFIKDKKILIVPIFSGGGIRVKILEAMAAGKIVISTDIGMQGIDAIPDEHYLRANTATDFMLAISWCLSNKKLCEDMVKSAQKLISDKYNQVDIAKRLSDKVLEMTLHQQTQ